jgi:small subunit ribosomal protein S3
LRADTLVREYIEKKHRASYVADIEFERNNKSTRIMIHTSRPGMLIGRSGEGATKLRTDIINFMKSKKIAVPADLKIDIIEVTNPDANAKVTAISIAEMLEKRMTFRRTMKMTIEKIMQARGVKGAKIVLSGRLGGADMARREELKQGGIPLQFMRGDVEYATETARLSYGGIGIKVWIYKGDTLERVSK